MALLSGRTIAATLMLVPWLFLTRCGQSGHRGPQGPIWSYKARTNDVALEDVKLKGAQISFTTRQASRFYEKGVLQPPDKSPETESKFQGAISGDTSKGKVEREFAGNVRTLDWEAKRVQK